MARQLQALGEQLQAEATCPLCLELFSRPVLTACGHSLCSACAGLLLGSPPRPAACPQCRAAIEPGSLRPNFPLGAVAELAAALEEAAGEEAKRPRCPEHGEALELFCQSCSQLLCPRCPTEGPRCRHRARPAEEAAKIMRVGGREGGWGGGRVTRVWASSPWSWGTSSCRCAGRGPLWAQEDVGVPSGRGNGVPSNCRCGVGVPSGRGAGVPLALEAQPGDPSGVVSAERGAGPPPGTGWGALKAQIWASFQAKTWTWVLSGHGGTGWGSPLGTGWGVFQMWSWGPFWVQGRGSGFPLGTDLGSLSGINMGPIEAQA